MAKGMADIFGKGAGGAGAGGGMDFGSPTLPGDEGMDEGMDTEDEEPQGDLASALATAGYPNVTPDQISQIEAILGAPGGGMEDMGMEEGMGDMGGEMPPMPM